VKNKHAFDTVHGAQEVFRLLLEALSNPGRVLNIRRCADQFAAQGRWLAPAITLLDTQTGFFWDGDSQTGEEIRFLTGAPRVSLEEADFAFLSAGIRARDESLRILSRVKRGTHLDPHTSALLFIAAETGEGRRAFLTGPGIPPEGRTIYLSPGEALWCQARDELGFEYPCGVEFVFLREDGSLMALTRKTKVQWNLPPRAYENTNRESNT
jgi:alpha-D-ribose 1-methylphosphonate 5-triphosphate synthase subunit PhnH